MSYVRVPITVNPAALVEEANAEMEALIEGWEPSDANVETFMFLAIVYRLVQPLAELAADVPDTIFENYGEKVLEVLPHLAVPATVKSKWTAADEQGYTIPAGTQLEIPITGDESVGFVVATTAVIAPGETTATEVELEAIEPGAEGNDLSGAPVLLDALKWVEGVELEGETSGGQDAEEPTAYLDRLSEVTTTLAPRPIIARDVAILSRTIAGVQRAAVVDNYNDETEAGEQEKTTSVYPVDASGAPVSEAIKEELEALLAAKREANYIFIVADPTITEIDVKVVGKVQSGFEPADVAARVEAAVAQLLDPAYWGGPPSQAGGKLPTIWNNETTLRYQDVVTAVNNVQGFDYYTTLEIRKHGGSYGTADVTLTGKAALPDLNENPVTMS